MSLTETELRERLTALGDRAVDMPDRLAQVLARSVGAAATPAAHGSHRGAVLAGVAVLLTVVAGSTVLVGQDGHSGGSTAAIHAVPGVHPGGRIPSGSAAGGLARRGALAPSHAAYGVTPGVSAPGVAAVDPPGPLPSCPSPAGNRPSDALGTFCGPSPHAGNGLGPDGTCTGAETGPPCGPGAVPGRYYAYTVPGSCEQGLIFDARRWDSELPPPTPIPDFFVWIAISSNGVAGWISPQGAVGLQPASRPIPVGCPG